ncbi:MAG: prepilin-type cleavage/methylation domain-containing protein [Methylophilaceae bacterium]
MKQTMMKQNTHNMHLAKSQQGAVLLEALIAVVIFSFGILALAGLQGAMVKNTTNANFRSEAGHIAQQHLGQIWGDPNNIANYVGTIPIATLPSGSMVVTQPVTDRVLVTVTWQLPGEAQHNYQANAYVLRGCPTCT